MANPSVSDLYAELDALTTSRGANTAADPVAKFIKTAKKQAEKAAELITAMEDGRDIDQDLVPQSDWFFRDGNGWAVKFGRAKISTPNGTEWFKATDLEHVIKILEIGVKLAQTDEGFQQKITDVSATNKQKFKDRNGKPPVRASKKSTK